MIKIDKLNPFGRMCLSMGMIPSSYAESLTYEEQLIWFCNFLEKEVIPAVNKEGEAIEELQALYVELKSYVDNYFENLDVQEEINNKLDDMVTSGEMAEIINQELLSNITNDITSLQNSVNTINNNIGTLNTNVSANTNQIETNTNNITNLTSNKANNSDLINFMNQTNTAISNQYEILSRLQGGTPLVVSSVGSMTDTSKIYVNTTDGKWYYYDGDSWEIGGTYQATAIADNSVTLDDLASDTVFNLNTRINDNNIYNNNDRVSINLTNNLINAVINNSTGQIETRTDNIYFSTPNYYFIGDKAFIEMPEESIYYVRAYYYDKDYTFLGYLVLTPNETNRYRMINMINGAVYVRFRISKLDTTTTTTTDIITNIHLAFFDSKMKIETTKGNNMFNPYKYFVGYMKSTDGFIIVNLPDTNYRTTYPIPVKNGVTYYIKKFRFFMLLNNDYSYVNNTMISANTENYTFTPNQDGYVVFSYTTDYSSSEIMAVGNSEPEYEPYIEYLPPYLLLQNVSNLQGLLSLSNILDNKKYVALGDSFTHGDFTNSPTNDYIIESGLYTGQYKVYPYLIGNRNNMYVSNLAQNGMTITNIDGTSTNYISDTVLSLIPNDVDYITIKIGINDNPDHKNAPLGTIDSVSRETFYGAWNYVMNYLITNYPNAKIGIIISNGMTDSDFIEAEINIAKKYGVCYLNETTDPNVPLLIRTQRSDVLSSIKNVRDNYYEVNPPTNGHPNAKCHEFESTIVENFLRTL